MQRLIEALEAITPEYRSRYGICNIAAKVGVPSSALKPYILSWPDYSGDISYPVPELSGVSYGRADPNEMWSPDHPYGAFRRRLLAHIIEELNREQD